MRTRQTRITGAACLLFLFIFVQAVSSRAVMIERMPEFSLPSAMDGKDVSSRDFSGDALLITFFTTWCPPCRKEIPSLIKLQKKFEARGFSVIALSMDEKGPKVVVKLMEKESINYPVLMSDSRTEKAFGGITGIPTTFLVDREGKVMKRYPGYVPYSVLEEDVKSLL